jgi:hypothetical protein
MKYFNELTVDIGDGEVFPSPIFERTRENPNMNLTDPCQISEDSLEECADRFLDELFHTLRTQVN